MFYSTTASTFSLRRTDSGLDLCLDTVCANPINSLCRTVGNEEQWAEPRAVDIVDIRFG